MKPNEFTGAKRWHKMGFKGDGVVIAIVDTGVQPHTDLTMLDGWGTGGIPPDVDANGHGTHVAGIAAGKKYGVAPNAKILPVRITSGISATGAAMADGLDWLLEWHNKHSERLVVNISFTGTSTPMILSAINKLVAADVPVCVAAGNDGKELNELGYYTAPVVVGNLATEDSMATSSNCHGKETDCVTIGTNVESCNNDGKTYCIKSGTSMASPAVAGMLALILSRFPKFTEKEAVEYLLATGKDELVKCKSGSHYIPHVSFDNVILMERTKMEPKQYKISGVPTGKAAIIRATAGGEKIATIKNGRVVVAVAEQGDYIQIAFPVSKTETNVGWIAKKFLVEVG